MKTVKVLALSVMLTAGAAIAISAAEPAKHASVKTRSQEIVGTIVSVDLEQSTMDIEYESDDQTHQMTTETFYVTGATTIDVATIKSSLQDLKVGAHILMEYAQMPDGAKVVESVWVKKS